MVKFNSLVVSVLVLLLRCHLTQCQSASDYEMEEITEKLYKLIQPNLMPYITVNLQGETSSWSRSDNADLPLLTVDESILNKMPTIVKMRALFDNYVLDSSAREVVTANERAENTDFLNEILKTPIMTAAMKFLQKKGVVSYDHQSHFDLLEVLWFDMYARSHGQIGSSGFEHIFMNEMKYGDPIGMHNWIYYHHQEQKNASFCDLDYKGYMRFLRLGNKAEVIKFRFSFKNMNKPVNSMLIGTPPELDMALYTICFEMGFRECPVKMGGKRFTIRSFPFYFQGKKMIGSAYPVI